MSGCVRGVQDSPAFAVSASPGVHGGSLEPPAAPREGASRESPVPFGAQSAMRESGRPCPRGGLPLPPSPPPRAGARTGGPEAATRRWRPAVQWPRPAKSGWRGGSVGEVKSSPAPVHPRPWSRRATDVTGQGARARQGRVQRSGVPHTTAKSTPPPPHRMPAVCPSPTCRQVHMHCKSKMGPSAQRAPPALSHPPGRRHHPPPVMPSHHRPQVQPPHPRPTRRSRLPGQDRRSKGQQPQPGQGAWGPPTRTISNRSRREQPAEPRWSSG